MIRSQNVITSTTWANKPSSYLTGQPVFMSNVGTKGSHWFYDGTRWKPVNGIALLATLDTASSNIANTETVAFQYLIPAGVLGTGFRLRLTTMMDKSGTTDTGNLAIRMGTAGTTADTAVQSYGAWVSAASRTANWMQEYRLASATSILPSTTLYGGNAAGTFTAVTISSASSNALYFSLSIGSTGATDTVSLREAALYLIAPAN